MTLRRRRRRKTTRSPEMCHSDCLDIEKVEDDEQDNTFARITGYRLKNVEEDEEDNTYAKIFGYRLKTLKGRRRKANTTPSPG